VKEIDRERKGRKWKERVREEERERERERRKELEKKRAQPDSHHETSYDDTNSVNDY
jgi:hypothetical protein